MARTVTARACGKVNLQLGVGAVRPDGFHPLASVFHAVALVEQVQVREGPPGSGIRVESVEGLQAADVPRDATNLAARAAARLAAELGRAQPDVAIAVDKGVPVAGGMAGGSADAAAALVALNELWEAGLTGAELARLGLDLGSDVPFALLGGTALGLGRGELLSPVLVRGTFHWVLATAHRGLSTPAVYAAFDRHTAGRSVADPAADPAVLSALAAGDARALGRALVNDLQEPALRLRPTLRDVLDEGLAAGALAAMVSGSGPTCAFLVADPLAGAAVAARLAGREDVRSTHVTTGPAPGARLV